MKISYNFSEKSYFKWREIVNSIHKLAKKYSNKIKVIAQI